MRSRVPLLPNCLESPGCDICRGSRGGMKPGPLFVLALRRMPARASALNNIVSAPAVWITVQSRWKTMKGQLSRPRGGFQRELWCESAGRVAAAQIRHAGSSAPLMHRPTRIKGF